VTIDRYQGYAYARACVCNSLKALWGQRFSTGEQGDQLRARKIETYARGLQDLLTRDMRDGLEVAACEVRLVSGRGIDFVACLSTKIAL
jgi:hypothetical protein